MFQVICAGVLKTYIIVHAHAYLNFSGAHNLLNITTALSVALNILIWHSVFFYPLCRFFLLFFQRFYCSHRAYNCFRTVCSHWTFTFTIAIAIECRQWIWFADATLFRLYIIKQWNTAAFSHMKSLQRRKKKLFACSFMFITCVLKSN